ncbi:hypothetical protein Bca101_059852 [Brassica carinata]
MFLMEQVSQVWSWKELGLLFLIPTVYFMLSREISFHPGDTGFKVVLSSRIPKLKFAKIGILSYSAIRWDQCLPRKLEVCFYNVLNCFIPVPLALDLKIMD